MKKSSAYFDRLALILTLCSVLIIATRPLADPDMWWHLSAGRAMWERGEILTHDIFSFTRAGAPWTNAFWIADLGMYFLYSKLGPWALALMVAALAGLTMFVVYAQAEGPAWMRMGVVILAMFAAVPIWYARPQLISYLFIAALDYFLVKYQGSPKRFLALIPFFMLWANIHGGFIWGFLLLCAYSAAKGIEVLLPSIEDKSTGKKELVWLIGCVALSALAIGVNPNGLALWRLPFYTVNISLMITEWLSPNFHTFYAHPMLWMIFALLAALGFSKKDIAPYDLFKVIGFAYLAFVAQRNMAPFAILIAPVLAGHLAGDWERFRSNYLQTLERQRNDAQQVSDSAAKVVIVVVACVLGLVFALNVLQLSSPEQTDTYHPAAAVRWIEQNQPEGRMFNSYSWGGYLTWTLPEYPVFVDGRADLYGDGILGEWQTAVNAQAGYMDILNEWNIQFVLLEPTWSLVDALKRDGWTVAFEDEMSVILERESRK